MNYYASWVFRCPRWVYFKIKNPHLEVVNPKIKKIGNLGEILAEKLLARNYRVFPGKKRRIYLDNFMISGKPDFRVLSGDEFEIVEVKVVRRMRKIPLKRWIAQLNLYLYMEDLKKGFLLEISGKIVRKSNWRFNTTLFEKSIEYFSDIDRYISEENIPPGRVGDCFNCSFRRYCRTLNISRNSSSF